MVDAFSLRTAHHFGDALASQANLRYRVFVQDRSLEHTAFEELEYDAFDTPGAMYFCWRDDEGIVRGLIRLLPTTLPYMVQSYWPGLMSGFELPRSRHVWEVTRLCVDRNFDPRIRPRIMPEVMCAVAEFCGLNEIHTVIGVSRKHLVSYFLRQGVEWLGPTQIIEGEPEAAFRVPLKHMWPRWHCAKLGISGPCLNLAHDAPRKIAA
jgi:acyl homoserine lactone synthase